MWEVFVPTKPVVKYTTIEVPINGNLNVPIVRKKVTKTEYVNWADKTEFTDAVDLLYVPPTSDTYVYIICQCGQEYIYVDKTEVPSSNLTCSCGRKVIEYGS